MRLAIFLLIISTAFVHCSSTERLTSERKQFKEVYINQFKLSYFRKILDAGFNHSEAVQALVKFDRSGFTEPVLSEADLTLINDLVYQQNKLLSLDSAKSIGRVAEGAEGKHVLGFILNRLESKWLDSVANSRYKQLGRRKFSD